MLEKKKLRDIAESISGIRPENRSLEGIVNFIEEKAKITYEKEPRTFLGRLRELGYALNGVRPTQRSLRGIVNNIYDNFNPEPPVPPIPENAILGVSGMYDESVNLTRTDDAVGLTYTKNADGTFTSDFDNYFPYKEMKRETINGNVFVKIPSMWFRIGTDENKNITDIAVSNKKGEGDNWYQTKEFYYGAYCGYINTDNSVLTSVTGVTPTVNKKIGEFRTSAFGTGEGYHQLDLYHKTILNFLFWIEFAVKDSKQIAEVEGDQNQLTTGLSDSIESPTSLFAEGKRFKYRNIEDFVGNITVFIEGIYANYCATSNPSEFGINYGQLDTLGYSPQPNSLQDGHQAIKSFGWDSNHPFLCMPLEMMSYTDTGYFNDKCDKYITSNNKDACYGNSSYYMLGGICDMKFLTSYAGSANHIGSRLLYCPNGV